MSKNKPRTISAQIVDIYTACELSKNPVPSYAEIANSIGSKTDYVRDMVLKLIRTGAIKAEEPGAAKAERARKLDAAIRKIALEFLERGEKVPNGTAMSCLLLDMGIKSVQATVYKKLYELLDSGVIPKDMIKPPMPGIAQKPGVSSGRKPAARPDRHEADWRNKLLEQIRYCDWEGVRHPTIVQWARFFGVSTRAIWDEIDNLCKGGVIWKAGHGFYRMVEAAELAA